MTSPRKLGKPSRVGIVLKAGDPRAREAAGQAFDAARSRGLSVALDPEAAAALGRPEDRLPLEDLCRGVDVVVSLGGDGTMLGVARAARTAGTPLLGVNLGELGYLTTTTPEDLPSFLDGLLAGQGHAEERRMLRAELLRRGSAVESQDVLNDVVVTKSALARILDIEVRINGTYVSTYRADGVIVATPTGSTAYTLAAGGPILHPAVDAIAVTPICPHMLTLRPLVVRGDSEIEARVLTARAEAFLSLDGQIGLPLEPGDVVRARPSPHVTYLLTDPARDTFATLREKLRWGGGPRSRPDAREG